MTFINKWSYRLAKNLSSALGETHQKRAVYYYGFQIIIGAIVKGILMSIVAIALGTLTQTVIVLTSFGLLRVVAGGYHMSSYNKCIAASIALFATAGLIAKYTYMYWTQEMFIVFILLTFSGGMLCLLKWAPRENPNRPITQQQEIRKLKFSSVVIFFILILVSSVLFFQNTKQIAFACLLGVILSLFIITPLGYSFFSFISGDHSKH